MQLEKVCKKNIFGIFFLFFLLFNFLVIGEGLTGTETAEFNIDQIKKQFKNYENYSYSLKVDGCQLVVKSKINLLKSKLPYPFKIEDNFARKILEKNMSYLMFGNSANEKKIKKAIVNIKNSEKGYFQAVDSTLRWVFGHFKYNEKFVSALEGNCDTAAELTVRMCTKLGVPARVVSGIVVKDKDKLLSGASLHSFVEIFYPDYGWMFSDPLEFFHFVPATYIFIDDIDEESLFALKITKKKYLKNLQFVDILDNSLSVKSRVNLYKFPSN